MLNLGETMQNGAAGLGFSLILTYLLARRKGAQALDTAKNAESSELRKFIEQQTARLETLKSELEESKQPKRTAIEERLYMTAKAALEKLGPDAVTVLLPLRIHVGMTLGSGSVIPCLPKGMSEESVRTILPKCVEASLATMEPVRERVGLRYRYTIAHGMEQALDELLYDPDIPLLHQEPGEN